MVMPILLPTKTATPGGDELMAGGNLVRLGGVSSLLAVVAMIPAYLVGYPDAPGSPLEAQSYFEGGPGTFVFSNGVLPLFHIFFFILFLGVLYATLSAAGFTVEILYPAVLQRFGDLQPDAAFVLVSLTLSSWLYHYCQIGTSVMVLSTSLVALGTGILPRGLALAGFVVAILTFLHFLLPLLAALVGLAWVAAVSVVMFVAGGAQRSRARHTR